MERLNWHLAHELSRYGEVCVIAPRGASEKAPPGVRVVQVPLRPLQRFLLAAGSKGLVEAKRFRPHWVLAGSGLTAPLALIAARLAKAKAVAYVHGLDLALPHPIYQAAWLRALRRLDRVIANSRATAALARKAGIEAARLSIVHPGVELPRIDAALQWARRHAFRKKWGLGDRPLLLSVGRLTSRKGLMPFVREVLPRVVRRKPDSCLLIVGDAPRDALAAEAEPPQAILQAARTMGLEHHVRWVGTLFGQDLESAYCAADVHVFPVREIPGDPEGFGMVAVEAAAHGLPTVAYATGGVVDAVAHGVSGRLVTPGDAEGFATAVLDLLHHPPEPQGIRRFAEGFSWESFGVRLAAALV
nr:glycosyltransferase family 4 protein [Desulfacinum hydrothermale]